MHGKTVLLIIGGGIAAYKSLEVIRRLAEAGVKSRAILTGALDGTGQVPPTRAAGPGPGGG